MPQDPESIRLQEASTLETIRSAADFSVRDGYRMNDAAREAVESHTHWHKKAG